MGISRLSSLPTWDRKKLMQVARDRGYISERALILEISKNLGLARRTVSDMIINGKFRWEHILIIGSVLEMTPKEFCDTFLSGYFIEKSDGRFVCHIDDYNRILHPPRVREMKTKTQKLEEERDKIIEEIEAVD